MQISIPDISHFFEKKFDMFFPLSCSPMNLYMNVIVNVQFYKISCYSYSFKGNTFIQVFYYLHNRYLIPIFLCGLLVRPLISSYIGFMAATSHISLIYLSIGFEVYLVISCSRSEGWCFLTFQSILLLLVVVFY